MAIFSAKIFFPDINVTQGLIYAYITYTVTGTLTAS